MNEALPLIETLFPRGIAQYLIGGSSSGSGQ